MTLASLPSKCSTCALGQFCLPVGLNAEESLRLDALARDKLRLKKGEPLFEQGAVTSAVYAVRLGTLKTSAALADGRSQVTGFHLPGELIGLDAIGAGAYPSSALALEDSEVCVIRVTELDTLSRQLPGLQAQYHRLMSREISEGHLHFLSLGSMRAEERLANFLLNLSDRYALRGYAANEFNLRMSREDIGSYLGMQIETVSRLFSRFVDSGLLQVKQRHVKFIDIDGVRQLAGRAPITSHTCPHNA
ncbi:MAG: hypothetical protein RIR70_1248 [Pseudomonadota bacterium]|jgi:CRP/FNR family transcriptional regulator